MLIRLLNRMLVRQPLLIFIPGLLLGQLAYALDTLLAGITILCCMTLQRFCGWRLRPLLLAVVSVLLVGYFTCFLADSRGGASALILDQPQNTLLIKVGDNVSFQAAGQLGFVGQIVALGQVDTFEFLKAPVAARFSAQYLPWREIFSIQPGAAFLASAKCKPIIAALYSTTFQGSLRRQGILYDCKIDLAAGLDQTDVAALASLRQKLITRVLTLDWRGASDEGGYESAGVLLAMTLGEKSYINQREKRNFREWGIAHLLVISGFHIGLFFSWCSCVSFYLLFFLRKFCWHLPPGAISRLFALACSAVYVALTGAQPSALRALLVITLFCIQNLRATRSSFFKSLLLSFFLLHLIWPFAILESGVQLSYAALLGIGLGLQLGEGHSSLLRFALVSLFATLGSGSLAYLIFGDFAPAAPIFNLLFVLPLSFIGTGLGLCAELLWLSGLDSGGLLIELVLYLLKLLVQAIRYFANFFGL